MNAKAISESGNNAGCTNVFLYVLGIVFFCAGAFFFWMIFLSPFLESRGSENWPTAKCKIISSKVKVITGDDSDSYEPDITYKYIVDGIEHEGNRHSFTVMSGQRKWARSIVAKYPAGAEDQCFYDPDDPTKSVLSIELGWSFYLFALFPLVFIAVGLGVIYAAAMGLGGGKKKNSISGAIKSPNSKSESSFASSNKKSLPENDDVHPEDLIDQEWSVPKKLKPETSRLGLLFIAIGIMAFWNGIVGIFVFQLFFNPPPDGRWFMILFLTPFVLVGLALITGVLYVFMGLFNPVVEIAMSTGAIAPGETVDIAWEVQGKASRFRKLTLAIHAEQTATYRRGTSTYTDNEIFEIIPIVETDQLDEMEFGSASITIPNPTMHTFDSNNNGINWKIVVAGDIPWWPNVNEAYPFRVKPG